MYANFCGNLYSAHIIWSLCLCLVPCLITVFFFLFLLVFRIYIFLELNQKKIILIQPTLCVIVRVNSQVTSRGKIFSSCTRGVLYWRFFWKYPFGFEAHWNQLNILHACTVILYFWLKPQSLNGFLFHIEAPWDFLPFFHRVLLNTDKLGM